MRWAIGDVHGYYTMLMKLLEKLNIDEEHDEVYFVGDFMDRALTKEEQLEVIKFYIDKFSNPKSCYKTVLGNHDTTFIKRFEEFEDTGTVMDCYKRYGGTGEEITKCLLAGIEYSEENELLCDRLYECMKKQPYYYKVDNGGIDTFIVHNWLYNKQGTEGFNNPDDIDIDDSLFHRIDALIGWGYKDKVIIHGHTPTMCHDAKIRGAEPGKVWIKNNNINVDCGNYMFAYDEGNLAAYCIETGECVYAISDSEKKEFVIDKINKCDWSGYGVEGSDLEVSLSKEVFSGFDRNIIENMNTQDFNSWPTKHILQTYVWKYALKKYLEKNKYLFPEFVKG